MGPIQTPRPYQWWKGTGTQATLFRHILDRGYGKPTQSIDAIISEDRVRYIVELPKKSATTEEWLEDIRREDAERSLVNGVAAAVDDEQRH
jgi:hypothetical protein